MLARFVGGFNNRLLAGLSFQSAYRSVGVEPSSKYRYQRISCDDKLLCV